MAITKLKRNKKLFEHRIGYISTQGDNDTVYIKTPKFKLKKSEACRLVNRKRKGTGYRCKKVYRDEITGVPF